MTANIFQRQQWLQFPIFFWIEFNSFTFQWFHFAITIPCFPKKHEPVNSVTKWIGDLPARCGYAVCCGHLDLELSKRGCRRPQSTENLSWSIRISSGNTWTAFPRLRISTLTRYQPRPFPVAMLVTLKRGIDHINCEVLYWVPSQLLTSIISGKP